MGSDIDQLRRSMPDLARLDPLSQEVRDWLDLAYDTVKRVDKAEGIILRMHERYLSDPAEKIVASAEIAEILERAARTDILLRSTSVRQRPAA